MLSLLSRTGALTVGAFASQLLALFILVVAGHGLSPEKLGPPVAMLGLSVLVASAVDMGMNYGALRSLAVEPDAHEAFRDTLSAKAAVAIVITITWIAGWSTLSLIGVWPRDETSVLAFGIYTGVSVISATLAIPLRARLSMGLVAAGQIVERCAAFAALLLLFRLQAPSPANLSISFAIGGAASMVTYAALIPRPLLSLRRIDRNAVGRLWAGSVNLGLVSLASQIQRADVAIVGVVAGPATAGVFAIASRILNPLSILPGSFAAALFPEAAAFGASRRGEILRATTFIIIVMVLFVGFITLQAEWILRTTVGTQYESGAIVLRIYGFAMLLNTFAQPAAAYLQGQRDEAFVWRVIAASATCGLVVLAVGAALWGAGGAALGFLVIQLLATPPLVWRSMGARHFRIGTP